MMGSKQSLLVESAQRLLRRGATARVKHLLEKARPEDVASIFPLLIPRERRQVFDLITDTARQALVLSEIEPAIVPEVLDTLPVERVVDILSEVSVDDVADILATLPDERAAAILERMGGQDSVEVEDLMGYPPETAGGIMSTEFFALNKLTTVGEATRALQEKAEDVEMAFYVYVVNEHGQLIGVVSLRQLVTTRPEVTLNEIAETDVVSVRADTDQEEVARLVARYNLLAVPVVDEANKLLGIVTVDDIIDVLHEEATEDILKLAGAGTELPAQATVREHLKMRYPWLVTSCVTGFIAALIMDRFLMTFAAAPFLAAFVPIIVGMGGNVGIQSSTIVVRGLATGHIELGRMREAVRREVGIALLLGAGYGLIVGVIAATYSWLNGAAPTVSTIAFYGLAVGLALAGAMLLAATVGTLVPLGLDRIGVDPAVATGPFVTGSIDVLGILAYFAIAVLLWRVLVL